MSLNEQNSYWDNPASDMGAALTLQQQQLVESAPLRFFWLDLADSNTETNAAEAEARLRQLMQSQQALATGYAIPQGFSALRQQVQAPRLDWRLTSGEMLEPIRAEAEQVFKAEQPHLLAWFWTGEAGAKRLLLAGSALSLDEGTVARIREVLIGQREADAEPEMQYLDYAGWISELQQDEDADEAVAFWQGQQLADLPAIELNERQGAASGETSLIRLPLARGLQDQLVARAEAMEAEPQLLALVVWAALLQRLSGREQFQLSRYHDCRDDYEELDDAMGLMQQPLPVPFYDFNGLDLQRAVSGLAPLLEEQLEYQEYVGQVAQQSAAARQVSFHWHSQNALDDIRGEGLPAAGQLSLQLIATDEGEGELLLAYDNGRYGEAAMQRLLARLPLLMQQALAQPDRALTQLCCLLDDEAPEMAAAQDSQDCADLVSLVRQQAVAKPNSPALRDGDKLYSYAELDQLSDRIAANLQQAGAAPETVVALCLPRSAELLLAMLAVLKTGAAYLPLDPEQPLARINAILADAAPVVLVAEDGDFQSAGELLGWPQLMQAETQLAAVEAKPQVLAYLLYTSGSTGTPKGVQVTQSNLMHYSQAAIEALQLPEGGHYGLVSSLMADLGNTMLFPAWLQGGCLHLIGREQSTDGVALAAYLKQQPLDCLKIVPSHLVALTSGAEDAELLPTQALVLGGERISDSLLAQLAQWQQAGELSARIYNHYGPTETTVGVLWQQLDLNAGSSALGEVLGSNRIYLLDTDLNPAVSGQVAELYIAGPNLSRGYLGASDRTAERYLPDPFIAGERCYRSGDLALRRADGAIEIVGRADQQVKIRGFRLELEEIEALLGSHATVQHTAVLLQGSGEQARLIAFAVPAAGGRIDDRLLRQWLADQLPDYMVPAQLIAATSLPLNANGKVDAKALLALAEQQAQREYLPPRNTLEQQICELWQEILQLPQVSIADSFFELGGHSLAAIKVVARLRQMLARELPTDLLFRKQSVMELAEFLNSDEEVSRLVPISQIDGAPTLVLMHSVNGDLNAYGPLQQALQEKVSLYGLMPDSGLLEGATAEQFDQLLEGYAELLAPLKAQPLILVGWSLASRILLQLSPRLLEKGFNVQSVAIIDYDPQRTLESDGDDPAQLRSDLAHYLGSRNLSLSDSQWQQLQPLFAGDYRQGAEALLASPVLQAVLGDQLPQEAIAARVAQRRTLKQVFYSQPLPQLNLPLWLWLSEENSADLDSWQAYSQQPVQGWRLNADHFSILASGQLEQQLMQLINAGDSETKGTA
ncbi:non-ribosomal peptide synthetase [Marinobacterium jannaschii]|uniref:non-ribosomal peptide synthetase n=1 Tax=Marinobacterium jannaschii TaxID=64970 RepID=UPI000684D622|nr:non-ribosomal peptide synthetase [Marinobacterium jannaschii]